MAAADRGWVRVSEAHALLRRRVRRRARVLCLLPCDALPVLGDKEIKWRSPSSMCVGVGEGVGVGGCVSDDCVRVTRQAVARGACSCGVL